RRGAVSARIRILWIAGGARMLRRIAVIIAAAITLCRSLAAQAGAETRLPTAALEATTPGDPAPAVSRGRVEQAPQDSIRTLDLQTELVIDKSKPFRLSPLHIPQEVLWVLLVLVAALLLYAMREELMNLFRPAKSGWEPPPPGTGEVTIGSETDALAAAD